MIVDRASRSPRAGDWRRPSAIALVVANAAPLAGVLVLKWDVFPLILLHWLENVAVGTFYGLQLATAASAEPRAWLAKVFLVPFFCFHHFDSSRVQGHTAPAGAPDGRPLAARPCTAGGGRPTDLTKTAWRDPKAAQVQFQDSSFPWLRSVKRTEANEEIEGPSRVR